MTKAKIFLILSLFFIAGVGLRSLADVPFVVDYTLFLLGIIGVILFWKNKRARIICFGLIFLALGILRYELAIPKLNSYRIEFYNGQKVSFVGVVMQEPDERKDHVKLAINVLGLSRRVTTENTEVTTESTEYVMKSEKEMLLRRVSGRVLINTYLYPEYEYGDRLEIFCELKKPELIEDFAYDKYLARYNIYSVCYRPKIKLLEKNQGNFLMTNLLKIKGKFISVIQRSLPEPQASFLGGLILGAKKSIPDDLMTAFNRTGTTHIVALSGFNITIIAVMIMNLCKALWINRKKSFWISMLSVVFFILITGAPSSAVRAGVMGILVLLATQLGRLSRVTNTLVLAALIMLLINPKVLAFDAGFQLSFLATLGLVFLSPKLEKLFRKLPNPFGLRENLVATLSAIILTMPLILYQFGRLSLVAPLVNVLILSVIPLAMGAGFVVGIAGLIWSAFGQIIGWLAWVLLSYIIFAVETFSKIHLASLEIGKIHWLWLLVFYSLIGFILFKKRPPFGKRRAAS